MIFLKKNLAITLGHTCLYEADKKILVSGDHILIDISPNIQCWEEGWNPLKSYMESLKKTWELEVTLVLPGHRRIFNDHRARVEELISHHEHRLMEVLNILKKGAMYNSIDISLMGITFHP